MGILRFLLAISVIIAHSNSILGFRLVGGQIAVQGFYIISGFYMAFILKEKYIGVNQSYKLFITNRLLRLYPVYWVVILFIFTSAIISYLISNSFQIESLSFYWNYISDMSFSSIFFLVFTNIFMIFQDMVMFLGLDISSGNLYFTNNFRDSTPMLYKFLLIPQAWTIGIEITFYLIAPFLIKRKLWVILVLILASLLLRIILINNGLNHDPWTYRFFPTELVFFLLGIVAYNIFKKLDNVPIKRNYLVLLFSYILVFTLFYSFIPMPGKMYFYLFSIFLSVPFIFNLSKKWKVDRYIGELSYPIYISHLFVYSAMIKFTPFTESNSFMLVLFTVLFSIFLNQIVIKKIEIIRQRRIYAVT